jgi:5-oxoprolinase (ATP-hydrolysing) subunit A
MRAPTINCDMGEGIGNDDLIMPYISAANIACGYHAGGEALIKSTIDLAKEHGVQIGAHISYKDKAYFGRREMNLSEEEVYALVLQQLVKIDLIARQKGVKLQHVKPHGALYNMAARDKDLARIIATAIKDFKEDLIVYGLSGSHLIREASRIGLSVANEVFADRTYMDDGSLTPRSEPDALITNEKEAVRQVLQILREGTVTTINGMQIPIAADTICIHGDTRFAMRFAKVIREAIDRELGISATLQEKN